MQFYYKIALSHSTWLSAYGMWGHVSYNKLLADISMETVLKLIRTGTGVWLAYSVDCHTNTWNLIPRRNLCLYSVLGPIWVHLVKVNIFFTISCSVNWEHSLFANHIPSSEWVFRKLWSEVLSVLFLYSSSSVFYLSIIPLSRFGCLFIYVVYFIFPRCTLPTMLIPQYFHKVELTNIFLLLTWLNSHVIL